MSENRLFSTSVLKTIAMVLMVIDHLTAFLYQAYALSPRYSLPYATLGEDPFYSLGRALGRPAFILFAFLIACGMQYSRNRYRYILRLALMALISEIPFDLVRSNEFMDMSYQNVFFTLVLGAVGILAIELLKKYRLLAVLSCAGCVSAAFFLKTDYGGAGVLLIIVFYLLKNNLLMAVLVSMAAFFGSHGILDMANAAITGKFSIRTAGFAEILRKTWEYIESYASREMYAVAGFLIVYCYNGRKGRQLSKTFYYLVYPVHLILIYIVRKYVMML